jgi:hypothetical protein
MQDRGGRELRAALAWACSSAGRAHRGRVRWWTGPRSMRRRPRTCGPREAGARLDHRGSSRVGRSRGEVERELASWGWPRPRRRTGTEPQFGEHPGDVVGLVGELHQSHRTPAARAGHDVDREHALQPRLVITSSSVAAPSSDNGIWVGSVGTDIGPGTTSGRALAWAASTP